MTKKENPKTFEGFKETKSLKKQKKSKEEHLKLKIKKLEEEVNLHKDLYLRKAAEFENYRKRTERNVSEIINNASENLIKELLPVTDDFQRTINAVDEFKDCDSIRAAVELIYNKFIKIMDNYE